MAKSAPQLTDTASESAPAAETETEATTTPESTNAATALAIPALPAGATFDLTGRTITFDDVTFTIPTQLTITPSDETFVVKDSDWLTVAKNTKLLYGINLDKALQSSVESRARANKAALVWMVPDSDDFVDTRGEGSVTSSLCYTESVNNLVQHRIMSGSLSAGTPFASGAAQMARAEKQASEADNKRLFMTGIWRYTQATLRLKDCTAASPPFVEAIHKALDTSPDQQFSSLAKVFNEFGHVVPESVVLGGQLYFQSQREVTTKVTAQQVTTTVEAAVAAKYDKGAEGGASASFGDGSDKVVGVKEIIESASFSCVGGDITRASAPASWASTVKNPNRWAIIDRQGLTPLVDWLDDADKEQVLEIWNAGLKQLWNGHNPPEHYAYPDFNNEPFTITSAISAQEDGALSYRVPKDFTLGPAVPAAKRRALVGGSPRTGLSRPAENPVLWRLVYTGTTTKGNRKGQPLYWIIAYPDQRRLLNQGLIVLAANTFDITPPVWVATVMDRHELQTRPDQSAATWTITPANPSTYGSVTREMTYQIRNFKTGRVLGPLSDKLDGRQDDANFGTALASFGFALPELCLTLTEVPRSQPGKPASAPDDQLKVSWICAPYTGDSPEARNDQMQPGDVLLPDQPLYSADRRYWLVFQSDGDLALYGPQGPRWHTGTEGRQARRCQLQDDGDLVIYGRASSRLWTSGTSGHKDSTLVVGNDGNAVIHDRHGDIVWTT